MNTELRLNWRFRITDNGLILVAGLTNFVLCEFHLESSSLANVYENGLEEYKTSRDELASIAQSYVKNSKAEFSRIGLDHSQMNELFLRFGYSERDRSRNAVTNQLEPGFSAFEAIPDPVLLGWTPDYPNYLEVKDAFNSCRICYLVKGERVELSPDDPEGVFLKPGYQYLAVMKHVESRVFRIHTVIADDPACLLEAKARDSECEMATTKCKEYLEASGLSKEDYLKTEDGRKCSELLESITWDRKWKK